MPFVYRFSGRLACNSAGKRNDPAANAPRMLEPGTTDDETQDFGV